MPKFNEHPTADRIKLLLLGDSGAGKTGLLSTVANAGYKIHILDVDNNLAIMKSYLTPEGLPNVDYVSLPANDPNTWKKAKELLRKWEDGTNPTTWDTSHVLVIDSASFLAEAALVSFKEVAKDPRQGYYAAQDAVTMEMARLTGPSFKCHLILTCHLRNIFDKIDEKWNREPAFTGVQLPNEVPRYMNNTWAVVVKAGDKRIIRTQTNSSYSYLKSSAPEVLKAEEDFDLGALFKKIESR